MTTLTSSEKIKSIFDSLVQEWKTENQFVSSTHRMVLHPAYQQIIGLGEPAIPLLLDELEKKSGRWFWALKAISRQDPVSDIDRGKTKKMIQVWLNWGQENGYRS